MRFFANPATLLFVAMLGLLSACGTGPSVKPGPSTAPSGPPGSAPAAPVPEPPRPTLAAEQQRLAELFRGTPVVFAMQSDGSLRVEVPLRFSFDAGSSTVKPPLAAVLDRLAASQRKGGSRLLVVAPTDKRSKALILGTERAVSARDYMVGRGISATRFAVSAVVEPDMIRIVISEGSNPRLL